MAKLRKLKHQDKKRVERLLCQLTGKETKINIKSLIKDKGCNCIVIEENKQVIGFGSLIVHQVPCEGYVARIEDVVIDSAWRGKGHGKRLTKELIAIAKNKKVKKINLTSNPKRITARNLYKNMGFEIYNTGVFKMDL
ncbi:MAG TPA: GNAT family N-acetyltransferase [Candidatus Moranbacteria bacterium]|nr:GNAT family N-acetyltransferase [Candidatus Moranbacteria bacterium]HRZ33839.1 GNAT family N-acetyltransferase [Candidatus Moranbacteria bacterium]